MKKLLTILLLFISFSVFGQVSPVTPQFKGGSALDGIQYGWPGKTGLDTLLNAKYYRNNGLKAKATDFEGAGTTSDKFGIRDTLLKSNWIIKSTSTSLPGITIDAENSDLSTPTIAVFKFNGSRVSAIGSAGGYFGRGVFANSGGDYASVFTDTTGTLISRKKADSNPVLRLINLSSGSTGDFLFAGDSTSTKFRITRQGGIIAPLLTDTTGLTKSIVWNPSTGKFYTQTGGGGGTYTGSHGIGLVGSDFRLVSGTLAANVSLDAEDTHNLGMQSNDGGLTTSSWLLTNGVFNGGVNQSGTDLAGFSSNASSGNSFFQIYYNVGVLSKSITMSNGLSVAGIGVKDNVENVGLNGDRVFPLTLGTQYAQYHKVDSIAKAKADSVKGTITGGVTSITPGVGFLSHTPITTSGTMNIDTASTIVTKTFAGRYVTNSSTTTFTNKTGNISQWTNDSGYITSASVPVAANPTASVGGSPVNGSATTFMRSDAAPKADTSVLQTVLNLFPKTDTRYKHDFTIAGHSIASNFNTTLATLSYGYGIALQSGTSTYDASGGSTFRVDTGATIQTVANFFPKGDTRYARTGSTGTVTSIATSTGITGGTITSTGTLKADTSVLQTVNNFHPLGNTFWVPTSRTVAGFALSSNVTLAALTATDATLTFSGSYTGATARTVGLNLGNSDIFTVAGGTTISGLGAATAKGYELLAGDVATLGNQKWSPALYLTGNQWQTGAVNASVASSFRLFDEPIQNANQGYGRFHIQSNFTGSFADVLAITGDGIVTVNNMTISSALSTSIINSGGSNTSLNLARATSFTTAGNILNINPNVGGNTISNSSGTVNVVAILPTYNQTSTAAGTDLLVNRTETAVGSGTQRLIDLQVGSASKFSVDNKGLVLLKTFTVSTLPTAGTAGRIAVVTDATAPTYLGTLTGGGSVVVKVLDNGSAWVAD